MYKLSFKDYEGKLCLSPVNFLRWRLQIFSLHRVTKYVGATCGLSNSMNEKKDKKKVEERLNKNTESLSQ